jgi:hypothetical protein
MNRFEHGLRLTQHLVIPVAQDMNPLLFKEAGPVLVIGLMLHVLAAVQLDGEFQLVAVKVQDVTPDGVLAAELQAQEAFGPQDLPKQLFGVGLLAS